MEQPSNTRRGETPQQEASSRGCPMQMRIGLDLMVGWMDGWMDGLVLALFSRCWRPSGPVAGRGPDSVRLSSAPLVEPRIGIRVVGIIRPSPWIALSRTGRPGQSRDSQGGWFARSRAKRRRLEVSFEVSQNWCLVKRVHQTTTLDECDICDMIMTCGLLCEHARGETKNRTCMQA